MEKVATLTWTQRRMLERLLSGSVWYFTTPPHREQARWDALPVGLVSKRYSSIGETREKVHYSITPAGRAALEVAKHPEVRIYEAQAREDARAQDEGRSPRCLATVADVEALEDGGS